MKKGKDIKFFDLKDKPKRKKKENLPNDLLKVGLGFAALGVGLAVATEVLD